LGLEELIGSCIAGDSRAQRELYTRYSRQLYGCCLRYASGYDDAQDILQETFITIFDKLEQYGFKGSFEGWCKRIAVNTALMRYRGTKVYELLNEDQLQSDDDGIEDVETLCIDLMMKLVQELPDRYRMCFTMYAIDGYSHKEIASMMEVTVGTSKSNVARARQQLKTAIIKWRCRDSSAS